MGISILNNYTPAPCSIISSSCRDIDAENYADAGQSLNRVLDTLPQDSSAVIAIGYTTRSADEQRSAVVLFANEAIPMLAEHGFTDVVLPIFPRGGQIDQELEKFNQTGRIGTEMRHFINVLDRPNFELLLAQAQRYHISLHAGGVDYADIYRTIFHPEYGTDPQPTQRLRDETRQNSAEVIRALVAEGKRVAFFGPCLYVNPHPRGERAFYSFGRDLARDFPARFAAINIVIPEITEGQSYRKDWNFPLHRAWRPLIPQRGVNLIESGRNSYLLVLPRR